MKMKMGERFFFNKIESNVFDQVGMSVYIYMLRSRIFKLDFLSFFLILRRETILYLSDQIHIYLLKFRFFENEKIPFLLSHLHTK